MKVRNQSQTPVLWVLICLAACDSIMLNTQYRMHPDISAFPIREFYGEKLTDGTDSKEMKPTTLHRLLGNKFGTSGQLPPVLFIDHDNPESLCGRSRANYDEMRIIVAIIQDLLLYNQDIKGEDIGIISPYVAQVRMLTLMLRSDPGWEQSYKDTLGEKRAAEIKKIEIKTVDGFEGREKEYIIFSTVRNNWYGGIGFLADKRRMNVALTRAKRALFVLGSLTTLSGGKHGFAGADQVAKMVIKGTGEEWKKFAQFVIARNLFIEYGRPAEYRSAEEMQEFEKLAGIPTILENNMNTTALI
jgi:superfamily I DNA and/or RNA helicase